MAWRSIHTAQFLCVRHRRMHDTRSASSSLREHRDLLDLQSRTSPRTGCLADVPGLARSPETDVQLYSRPSAERERESSSHSLRAQPARQTEEMSASCYKKQISRTTARSLPRPHDLAGGVRFLAASCIYIVGPRAAAEALMSAVSVRQRTTPSRKKLHATPHGWVFNDHGRLWPDGV